jgi:hypothetical protein
MLRARNRGRLLLSGCLCLALGCACERDAELKSEAGQLSRAIEELRGAPNEAKREALERLRKLPCTQVDTCSVQSACVAGYDLFVGALADVAEGKRLLGEAGDADVPLVLRDASAKLERARGLTQKCSEAQGEIVRRFKLR